jgi:hypothetical protein
LKRGKGLKRGAPLKAKSKLQAKSKLGRSKPIPKKNAKRKARRMADDKVYGSYFRYVKDFPCAVQGEGVECFGEVTGHHLKSVGSGGQDAGNLVPLCAGHHTEIHTIGMHDFDAKYFNDLKLMAKHLWARYRDAFGTEGAA